MTQRRAEENSMSAKSTRSVNTIFRRATERQSANDRESLLFFFMEVHQREVESNEVFDSQKWVRGSVYQEQTGALRWMKASVSLQSSRKALRSYLVYRMHPKKPSTSRTRQRPSQWQSFLLAFFSRCFDSSWSWSVADLYQRKKYQRHWTMTACSLDIPVELQRSFLQRRLVSRQEISGFKTPLQSVSKRWRPTVTSLFGCNRQMRYFVDGELGNEKATLCELQTIEETWRTWKSERLHQDGKNHGILVLLSDDLLSSLSWRCFRDFFQFRVLKQFWEKIR